MAYLFFPIIAVTILLLAGCHPKPIEGGAEIAKEAELHKVKRITEEQIFAEAYLVGDSITATAAQLLKARVSQALEKEGVPGAMKFCQPASYPEADSLLRHYQASLSRSSQLPRNPANKPAGKAADLLDAYHYNAEQKLPLDANVQKITDNELLYTKAILISDAMCLRCHGKPGEDIAPPDWLAIQAAYPTDKALGYAQGDLRGMWQVSLDRAGLVKSIGARSAKRKRKS